MKFSNSLVVFMALAGSGMLPATAHAVPADLAANVRALLDASYPATGPGAAVVVTENGKVVYTAAQGLADVEAKRPIVPDTVFRLGSITKQFAAAVVLQLAAEGKLSLDDRLDRFVVGYPEPGGRTTVRQLLNHTSGVQSYTSIPGWMEAKMASPLTTTQLIAEFRDLPAPSQPGEKWEYNNSGYVLVGAVIEAVTGKPWAKAVEERIAGPLRLRSVRDGVGEDRIPGMARGYASIDGTQVPAAAIHMSVPGAAGALTGTVGDLARWADALHHGKVVPARYYAQMIAPTALPDGKSAPYGYGLGQGTLRGRATIEHSGGIPGFSTDSLYFPKQDIFVAVFANSDGPAADTGVVTRRIAALAVGDAFPNFTRVATDPAALEPWFGVYDLGAGATRRFFARDGKLFAQRSGAPPREVFAAGQGRFFYGPETLSWFELKRGTDGKPMMAMHQNGDEATQDAVWAGPIPAAIAVAVPRAVLENYVGRFATPFGIATTAVNADGTLTMQLNGPPLPLRAISPTEFNADEVGARIVFKPGDGPVAGLIIEQGGQTIEATRLVSGG